jgi:hypothetical protein
LARRENFDGQICEDGVRIKGGIENSSIGGLDARSATSGAKRAMMDIEMTGEKQRIFVGGRITFQAFDLGIFIDAHLQEKRLDADISVQFTEHILFHLKMKANVPDSKSLTRFSWNSKQRSVPI